MTTLLAISLAGALGASGARGQTIDPQKAQAWLEQKFGIKSERVVEATPDALVVLRSSEPRPPSDFRAIVHLENFGPPDPLTPPSSEEEYFVNCPSRRFHVERIESFSENGARGAQSTSFGPSTWGKAIPNSTEERVVSAVCGPAPIRTAASPQTPAAPEAVVRPPSPTPPPVQDRRPPSVPATPPAPRPPPQPGSTRVQLFAGADKAAAQRFVAALPARLTAMANAGRPEIVEASAAGHPVYRVQIAGFASPAEAARFCSAARAAGQDCFVPPVAQR